MISLCWSLITMVISLVIGIIGKIIKILIKIIMFALTNIYAFLRYLFQSIGLGIGYIYKQSVAKAMFKSRCRKEGMTEEQIQSELEEMKIREKEIRQMKKENR
ncbi:MAG: hypothetical protein J5525_12335 [Lachnospiraceae bacterium]|nr:hypothetical protein [Lachnospiraceae bacterium]